MKKNEKKSLELLSTFKGVDDSEMKVSGVVGSTDGLDRHGDRINPKGWDLTNFKKNPVIMLNHDYHQFPIGKAINVKRTKNSLVFDIQFSKTLPLAQQAFGLVKEGIMKAWSVGFLVKEWGKTGGEYTIDKMELLELSLVGIPANPEALLNSLDDDKQKLVRSFSKLVKSLEDKSEEEEKDENEASKEGDLLEENKESEENEEKPVEEAKEVEKEADEEVEETKDEVEKVEEEKPEEEKVEEKALKLEDIEKMVSEEVEKQIQAYFNAKTDDVESDEEEAEDPKLLLLTAISKELKESNKDTGKSLRAFNQLLSTIKE